MENRKNKLGYHENVWYIDATHLFWSKALLVDKNIQYSLYVVDSSRLQIAPWRPLDIFTDTQTGMKATARSMHIQMEYHIFVYFCVTCSIQNHLFIMRIIVNFEQRAHWKIPQLGVCAHAFPPRETNQSRPIGCKEQIADTQGRVFDGLANRKLIDIDICSDGWCDWNSPNPT